MFEKLFKWLDQPNRPPLTKKVAEQFAPELNAPILEGIDNPPPGFKSKFNFTESDIPSRLAAIDWFSKCGTSISLDLSMPIVNEKSWDAAIKSCSTIEWENAELEAQNQLTMWLFKNDRKRYMDWNKIAIGHKEFIMTPLMQNKIKPLQQKLNFPEKVKNKVECEILGALMENSYLPSKHSVFFFLELLQVYEAGHFPCGWVGKWPSGKLLVF